MLLFMQGAGGFDEDRSLAAALAAAADAKLVMPQLPDEDMSFEGWTAPGRLALAGLGVDDLVVVVPFTHLVLNSADPPNAAVKTHDSGGHQFDGRVAELLS